MQSLTDSGIRPPVSIRSSANVFALQLASETLTINHEPSTITRNYDSLGRSSGFEFRSGAASGADYSIRYGFDEVGRFNQVSSFQFQVSNSFTYSYLPNSDLIQQMTNDKGLMTTRSYELNRNLLTQIQNNVGATSVSRFDYLNDPLGRRTSVKQEGIGDIPCK